jgi:hypothetical protein
MIISQILLKMWMLLIINPIIFTSVDKDYNNKMGNIAEIPSLGYRDYEFSYLELKTEKPPILFISSVYYTDDRIVIGFFDVVESEYDYDFGSLYYGDVEKEYAREKEYAYSRRADIIQEYKKKGYDIIRVPVYCEDGNLYYDNK